MDDKHPPRLMQTHEDSAPSQTIRAILGLRGLIIEGALEPGARVLEQTLVDRLGVSRTPARAALIRLCEEGLLEQMSSGGYVVARFSANDVFDAIAIRGTLEGMAALRSKRCAAACRNSTASWPVCRQIPTSPAMFA